MMSWKFGLIAAFALSPLVALSVVHGGALFSSADEKRAVSTRGMVGGQRDAVLAQFTATYVSNGKGVTGGMRNGTQLAPISFLNERLSADGIKWRVKSVDGLLAKTFGVS